jgi:hypothetical protein
MIADISAPFGPAVFIFPFNYLFDGKTPGVLGGGIMNNAKTAAAYIGNAFSLLKPFLFGKPRDYAVKVDRRPRIFVRNRRRNIFNGPAAPGAIGNRQGIG